MSGESEVEEPFSVEGLCHVLKDFDAAGVIFDEVVVGGEGSGDFVLDMHRWTKDFGSLQILKMSLVAEVFQGQVS